MRSTVMRPFATPSLYTTESSVSMPGLPLLILSNDSRQVCFSSAKLSGTWSVDTAVKAPSASPTHKASRSAGERSGGEIT